MTLFDLQNLKPMPTSLTSERKPIIIGHRGAMAVAPENTMHAFQAALEAGADGIEFDVQRTIDGHLIIFHDEDVARTSDGQGLMPEMTLAEMKALDVGLYFGEEFRGTRVSTLDEFFEWVQGNNLLMFLEMKEPFRFPGIEHEIADTIQRYQLLDRVQVRSFCHTQLHNLHVYAPEISISELWYQHIPTQWEMTYRTLNLMHTLLTEESIETYHNLGRTVTTWVVDDLDEAQNLIKWGIDGITTNDPANLLTLFNTDKT